MIIRGLKLYGYRNYEALVFKPHERLTVLLGENAQGKTNALEAVYICATGKSHRNAKDAELVRFGCEGAYVRVDLTRANIERRIELKLLKNGRKQILLDGAPIRRMGELMGCLNAVLFSPEELALVKNGPGERRRFMDVLLCQTDASYFYALASYQKALGQRNALLKSVAQCKAQERELDVWDEQLALYSETLCSARGVAMRSVAKDAAAFHDMISDGREALCVKYKPDICGAALLEYLGAFREDDIRRGQTHRGPHRDDVSLSVEGNDLRAYGSQGQQRTAALSLKLAELPYMEAKSGEKPVLLLDDVLSELDSLRQKLLLLAAAPYQTILTATSLPRLCRADAVWEVAAGTAKRI